MQRCGHERRGDLLGTGALTRRLVRTTGAGSTADLPQPGWLPTALGKFCEGRGTLKTNARRFAASLEELNPR